MLPAVKPSPPAERTQPETSPLLSVIQGCLVVLVNSSWNLVSSASSQRSLPCVESQQAERGQRGQRGQRAQELGAIPMRMLRALLVD